MAKSVPDAILDLMLDQIEGTYIHVCSAEPANYAGIAAVTLATKVMTGSYTAAAGDVSGRKNIVPAQTAISITQTGTANHVVISNGTDTMYSVTTCTAQGLTSGGTTKLLDRMEEAGLIRRAYGVFDDDHRGVQVSLTPRGRKLLRTAAGALVDHLPDVSSLVKNIVATLEVLQAD